MNDNNKTQILLTVVGSQFSDGQKDKIELTTIGSIETDDSCYIVKYTEEQEPPGSAVDVTVKIKHDNSTVEMTRAGAADSCLIIERSKRNLCHYGTDYGDIMMGIYGRAIESCVTPDKGSFAFGYDIDINGAVASKNKVEIEYKKTPESILCQK